jgi:hypothetical protein
MRSLVVALVAGLLGLATPARAPFGAAPCAAQPVPDPVRRAPADDPALPGAGEALANEADEEGDVPGPLDGAAFVPPPLPPDPLAGRVITSSPERVADLVVVVSIDGLRADAVLTSHPTMSALATQGVIAPRTRTIGRSTTLASHASMLSGVDDDQHGLTWNSWRPNRPGILFPTALRIAARAGFDAALVVTKSKLQHLLGPWPDGVALTQSRGSCAAVVRHAEPWLRETRAGVALLHFPEPDSAGHRRGWMSNAYRRAVDEADRCLGEVVRAIEARPRGAERVLLIVTADHGGHGRSHGTLRDEDRHIPWIAWGGAAQRGARVDRDTSTMDTAATVLAALGLPRLDGMRGQVVREALRAVGPRDLRAETHRGARRTRAGRRPTAAPRDESPRETPHERRARVGAPRRGTGTVAGSELERATLDALARELRTLDGPPSAGLTSAGPTETTPSTNVRPGNETPTRPAPAGVQTPTPDATHSDR